MSTRLISPTAGADLGRPGTMARYTYTYKTVDEIHLLMDVYLPRVSSSKSQQHATQASPHGEPPIVIYFHGGGLTVGNKDSWFPHWLHGRLTAAGCAFASVEYRLLPPSTGHDILVDVKDAFHFVSHELNVKLLQSQGDDSSEPAQARPRVDIGRIAVCGTSSGGLCAYLAAMHASPRPTALLSMYGMGGHMLTPHYLMPKSEVFFRGRELLDPARFNEYLYPHCRNLLVTINSPLAYHPATSPTPGYPANPRMQLARLYFQLGTYLDYYTGHHEPSLSAIVREAFSAASDPGRAVEVDVLSTLIPTDSLPLFPQAFLSGSKAGSWPATFLVHGTADTAVHADESRSLDLLLQRAGVEVTLRLVEGKEHSFDYADDAEDTFGGKGGLYDEAADFLCRHLGISL
ncbi:Alpha/Beta hydrolase protein [Rhodofomes roseus]|uniref:Alpha/Beta hydrolase protein n=1 Tax=Rhodofomes roseus TaxID=34475 RepID=A0ABQ8KS16_9APHY|nr:Alpha/Beta hydrolase protein [Rhodofomes roseus]KAH9841593.1 Alpha/Beta hydrolase protein [Rhodofomes roseus]